VLIGNVQININFGVIWHFMLFFLYSRKWEMLELNTKVNTDYIPSFHVDH